VCTKAGGAYAASVPTVISAAEGVPSDASDEAVSVWTSDGDVSLMVVLSLLLIMAEVGVVMLLDRALGVGAARSLSSGSNGSHRVPSRKF
jgi:hypothetical protein